MLIDEKTTGEKQKQNEMAIFIINRGNTPISSAIMSGLYSKVIGSRKIWKNPIPYSNGNNLYWTLAVEKRTEKHAEKEVELREFTIKRRRKEEDPWAT